MGAKSWMIAYSQAAPREVLTGGPSLDEAATDALVSELFRGATRIGEADLFSINPPNGEIVAGVFPGVTVLAASDFGVDYPSKLHPRFVQHGSDGMIHLHAQHSVVDWFAFGVWRGGELIRSLSVSPDFGVMEDVGERMPFELPFWDGAHPAVDEEEEEEYGLPFHPLELSEVALPELFGFVLEGMPLEDSIEPDEVSLLRYAKRPWWKSW